MAKAPDFKTASLDDIEKFVSHCSPEVLEKHIDNMDHIQVRASIIQINEANDGNWRKKTQAAIKGLTDRSLLEAAGMELSIPQIFELLDSTLCLEDKHHWKLSPILVGMSHETFSKFLLFGTEKEISILKHESITEPVQHHLTLLSHELANQIKDLEIQMQSISREIENLNIHEMSRNDAQEFSNRIDELSLTFHHLLEKNNLVLAIAWNTYRLDLIESLNVTKDHCQKSLLRGIGNKNNPNTPGLYTQLKQRLFRVYGDPLEPEKIDSLHDHEPAIEGISKLEVWYLRDYLDYGLLPGIKKPEELDLDLSKHTESERMKHRERLFALAKHTLENMGLSSVNDLKEANIFSKKTLKEYIDQHALAT
jgi:hypothetical protein